MYRIPEIPANPNANPPNERILSSTCEETFQINSAKRYVPVVTLSIKW